MLPTRHMTLSYELWKQAVNAYGFAVYHLSEDNGNIIIFSGSSSAVLISMVNNNINSSDYSDWNTNFQSDSTSVSFYDDAILRVAGCCSLKPVPRAHDGKIIQTLNAYEENLNLYVAGRGDTASNIGDGTQFYTSRTSTGTTTVEFFFRDWVQLGGGEIWYSGMKKEDHITMYVSIPATPVTENGSNEGNVNIVSNIIVPAAGDGTHDLTLADGIPIISSDSTGYWNWDWPNSGEGNITAAVGGDGNIHLSDIAYSTVYLNIGHMIGSGHMSDTFAGVLPKKLLPQWKGKVELYTSGSHTVEISWMIVSARYYSS